MNEARERLRLVSLPFYKLQYYHNDIDATNGGVQCAVNNCYITVTVKDKDALSIKLTNPNIEFDLDEIKNSADRIIKVVGDLDQIKEALVIEINKQRSQTYDRVFWELASAGDSIGNVVSQSIRDKSSIVSDESTNEPTQLEVQPEISYKTIEVEKIVEKEIMVPVYNETIKLVEVEKIVEVPIEVETIKREIVEVEKPRESLWTKAKRFFGFKK